MDKLILHQKIKFKNPQIFELKPEEELRIYEITDFIRIRLLDGQAAEPSDNLLETLLTATLKSLKQLSKAKLSDGERRRIHDELHNIRVDDIRRACEDNNQHTINNLTSLTDPSVRRVQPPNIQVDGNDRITSQVSKDFQSRANGYFGDLDKHTIKMKDILHAVFEIVN